MEELRLTTESWEVYKTVKTCTNTVMNNLSLFRRNSSKYSYDILIWLVNFSQISTVGWINSFKSRLPLRCSARFYLGRAFSSECVKQECALRVNSLLKEAPTMFMTLVYAIILLVKGFSHVPKTHLLKEYRYPRNLWKIILIREKFSASRASERFTMPKYFLLKTYDKAEV